MIESPGIVEQISDDAVWVRLTAQETGCGRCHEPGGCGGAGIAYAFGKPNDLFKIDDAHGYAVGEPVRLLADDRAALYAGLASYGLPTLGALVGAAIGSLLGANAGAIAGMVLGLLVAAVLVKRVTRSRGWSARLQVSIEHATARCLHSGLR